MSAHKPAWLRVKAPSGEKYVKVKSLLKGLQLHTVCEEAQCPNSAECWGGGTATIMILGDVCTRGCRFCAVKSGNPEGRVDPDEPRKVAAALAELEIKYAVLTSVDRDDLQDGGAGQYARTISAIKEMRPDIIVEALIPDFSGDERAMARVVEAGPDVIGHNIETVERLTPRVRDRRSTYRQSLTVLGKIKRVNPRIYTKSSIMLGLGETEEEVLKSFIDLREVGVDLLTIGQYLRPSEWHIPVSDYVPPERFERYRELAQARGFLYTASGPLVRSSYRAGEFFIEALTRHNTEMMADGR
jgi:lipoic acid synthetase